MAEPRLEIHGMPELVEGSLRLSEKIGEGAERRFQGIADQVAAAVRGRVPRDSGALAAAYTAEPIAGGVAVGIPSKDDVPYAGWIEFGGSREGGRNSTAERPYVPEGRYLFPLGFEAEPVLVAEARDVAHDEIGGYSWKTPSM